MIVYISGPITGKPGYMRHFRKAQRNLEKEGHKVINPAVKNRVIPEGSPHEVYMEASIKLLKDCDCIYMLNGWKQSQGAIEEFIYAYEHNISITFEGGR